MLKNMLNKVFFLNFLYLSCSFAKSILNQNNENLINMEADIKWLDDFNLLSLLRDNSTNLVVIDTRNSNEYNGWKSFEKYDYNTDTVNVFSGHFKGAHNFEIEWLFNFNESLIVDLFKNRVNLIPNSHDDNQTYSFRTAVPVIDSSILEANNETQRSKSESTDTIATTTPLPVKSYEVLVYDTKLERLEAMRDFLLHKYKIKVLYLYKIIDKRVLYDTMASMNMTDFIEFEQLYDLIISPEYLYSIIFNPLASASPNTKSSNLTETTEPQAIQPVKYKLFDISYGDENQHYSASHIPTSVHLDTNEIEEPPIWNRKSRAQLIQLLADLGIKPNSSELIILYGNPDPMSSYRVAVIFKWLGVSNVYVLNGGYRAWLRKNFPIEKKYNKRIKVEKTEEYESYFNNKIDTEKSTYIVDFDFINDLVKNFHTFSDQYSLVDIRSWQEFIGETSGYTDLNVTGRIPGAIWGKAGSTPSELEDYRNPDLTMRSSNDIRKMWSDLGIDYENKHLIFYCGSGWRAAEVLIYAELMGLKKISLYDGGFYEWSSNSNNTIETGIPQLTPETVDGQTTSVGINILSNNETIGNIENDSTKSEDKNSSNALYSFNLLIVLNIIFGFFKSFNFI